MPETQSFPQLRTPTDSNEFRQILRANARTLAMFSSPSCSPCKTMYPLLNDLGQVLTDLEIVVVDITQFPALGNEYRVRSLPTLMLFQGDVPERTHIGSMPFHRLVKFAE